MTCLRKKTNEILEEMDEAIGQVTIGSKKNLVCVPSNSVLTVSGKTNKLP